MKAQKWLLFSACVLVNTFAAGADVSFSGAKVGLVETRTNAWGSWLIISVNDAAGNQILRLCDAAEDKRVMVVPLSDLAARLIHSVALAAKATGKSVSGWGWI